jgi:hypothetical protein
VGQSLLAVSRAFEVLGYRPAKSVGKPLECCDFAFSRFPLRLLAKSGTFSAYAQAGLVVLAADADSAVDFIHVLSS